MIETIIKLDGTEQPFIAAKVNGWGEWAAEKLGDKVDWSSVVMDAIRDLNKTKVTSQELQEALIEQCLARKTWSYYLMAGRLYAVLRRKSLYGMEGIPSIKALHAKLFKAGLMVKLNYSTKEYREIQKMIQHDRDLDNPHFALHHIRSKYSLRNRVDRIEYETAQFVYMRMAMALSEHTPVEERLEHVKNYYFLFSNKKLSAPTPNYVNLGTAHKGFASCCLFASTDEGESLAVGDWIGNMMTQNSAGIGVNIMTRSIGEAVRGGAFPHKGKLPYYSVFGKAVICNEQNGRGGAGNVYFDCFDPEGDDIIQLRDVRATEDKKNRDLHFTMIVNKLFVVKAAKGEDIFTFSIKSAPDLHAALYSGDPEKFAELYAKYEADETFVKNYIPARKRLVRQLTEAYQTGTAYWFNVDEVNRHTPFLDPILSSNLCVEICEPTKAYSQMIDLYSSEDHGRGEIATCSLAAIPIDNIKSAAEYEMATYYALKMIDFCIYNSKYTFPHLEFTAKQRMSAGVGITGLATHLAEAGLTYTSEAGKRETHFVNERHMYYLIKASLKIAKERGNAPWIHKTKWAKGWLPLDTYNRNVDGVVEGGFDLTYNWEALRGEIIAQGGIAHSVLVAHMPVEASSKAVGGTNSEYPVRRKAIYKSDGTTIIQWAAPFSDDPKYVYETAWDIKPKDLIDHYAISQKWTDQSISADLFRRIVGAEKISSNEMVKDFLYCIKMGMKTRYYQNTETTAGLDLESLESAFENNDGVKGCSANGTCTL